MQGTTAPQLTQEEHQAVGLPAPQFRGEPEVLESHFTEEIHEEHFSVGEEYRETPHEEHVVGVSAPE